MKFTTPADNTHSAGADPAVTALLRATYAAPSDDRYWRALEQRVMARLTDTPVVAWWAVMSEWRSAGAIAAALALLIAGATMVRENVMEQSARAMAARAAINSAVPLDDGALSFGVRVRLPVDAPERYLDPFDY